MPISQIALTEQHQRAEALLKEQYGDRPYTELERQQALDEVGNQMLKEDRNRQHA